MLLSSDLSLIFTHQTNRIDTIWNCWNVACASFVSTTTYYRQHSMTQFAKAEILVYGSVTVMRQICSITRCTVEVQDTLGPIVGTIKLSSSFWER